MPDRVRWTYENSDAVVEGSREKFREMSERAPDMARGAPELLEGEAVEGSPGPDSDEAADPSPDDLLSHAGGGWYEVEELDEKVRGKEEALAAAREILEAD